jgi:membrane dipeptidase
MISRRTFIQNSLAATAVLSLPSTVLAHEFLENYPAFDLHCHPGLFVAKGDARYMGDEKAIKTVTEMNEGKLMGAFIGLVADAPIIEPTPSGIKTKRPYEAGEPWKEYQRQMSVLRELLKVFPATLATKSDALDAAIKNHRVAAFISCEGGDFIDNPDRADEMYHDGIRSIQLVHYAPNSLGDLQTSDPQHNGLSKLGKELVIRMNKLGMLVDVAHATLKTVQDVASATAQPIMLSHSILKMEETRPLAKRAITPEHAKVVASTGGIIGAWPSGFNTSFEEFVDNTKRLVDVVGVDHVGLGTDMDGNFKPVISSYVQVPKWAEGLRAKGFSKEEVGKVLGGNARRVLKKVIG